MVEEEFADELPRAGLADADPHAARGGTGDVGLGREATGEVTTMERKGAREGRDPHLVRRRGLEGRDEPAVDLGRPAPPDLPLLRLLLCRGAAVRDGAAGGAQGGRAGSAVAFSATPSGDLANIGMPLRRGGGG